MEPENEIAPEHELAIEIIETTDKTLNSPILEPEHSQALEQEVVAEKSQSSDHEEKEGDNS